MSPELYTVALITTFYVSQWILVSQLLFGVTITSSFLATFLFQVVETDGTGNTKTVILGDPLETDNAVFSVQLEPSRSYTASVDGGEEFSLISFTATGGESHYLKT